jgi:hypothetical protein
MHLLPVVITKFAPHLNTCSLGYHWTADDSAVKLAECGLLEVCVLRAAHAFDTMSAKHYSKLIGKRSLRTRGQTQ